MAGLLYYLPGKKNLASSELAALGLVAALGDGFQISQVMERGPDGGPGLIAAAREGFDRMAVGNYPDRQTWQQIPGKDAWLGFYTEDRPTPADLVRREPLTGHLVQLADGNDWLIPVARGWMFDSEKPEQCGPYIALPQSIGMGPNGEWDAGQPVARYGRLWETACAWWDTRSGTVETGEDEGPTTMEFDFAGGLDAAVDVLAVNYRAGRFEVAILGLFDNLSPGKIFDATIDWPTIVAWSKKNEDLAAAADSSTDAGPPDSPPDIDPHSPTSGH